MSAFVVTETGVVVEYPTAMWISWMDSERWNAVLYERKNEATNQCEGFVARVPKGCLVSFDRPGVIKQAPDAKQSTLADAVEIVTACVEGINLNWQNCQRLVKLKKTLARFDARSRRWKGK